MTEEEKKRRDRERCKLYRLKNKDRIKANQAKWREANREYDLAKKKQWYRDNRESALAQAKERQSLPEVKARRVKTLLKFHYGEDAENVRPRPETCEICGRKSRSGRGLCYEHCHSTGKFRGWTCSECNVAIGRADDDPKILRAIADYLDRFNAISG